MSQQAALQQEPDFRESESLAMSFERVLNTEEAAALLQIHPKTLQRMARQGVVPAFRIGDLWRFRASSLDQWLRSGLCSKCHSSAIAHFRAGVNEIDVPFPNGSIACGFMGHYLPAARCRVERGAL